MQIIEGSIKDLFKALDRLGIEYLDQHFAVERVNIRRFDNGTQGAADSSASSSGRSPR